MKRITKPRASSRRAVAGPGIAVLLAILDRPFTWAQDTPAAQRRTDVRILDIFGNTASVRVDADRWIDYLHIAKWNGRWVIINVLWENRP